MFGALNRFIARLDSDGPTTNAREGHGAFGFQVLRNKNAEIPIEPWYDFIIGINGRPLVGRQFHSLQGFGIVLTRPSGQLGCYAFCNRDPQLRWRKRIIDIMECKGTLRCISRKFTAARMDCCGDSRADCDSSQGQRPRTLSLPVPTPSPTLGLTLQWTPLTVTEDVWHILEVTPHSPADNAGLLPYGDYIIGSPEGTMHGEAGLGELVEDYLSRSLRLFVYNHEYGVTRLVTITPSRSWGGNGALGCMLGFGALHRLPVPLNEPPPDPGETMFETARFSNEEGRPPSASGLLRSYPSGTSLYQGGTSPLQSSDGFLVPANMGATAGTGPPKVGTKAGRRPKRAGGAGGDFDQMFKEGEEKSREEDRPTTSKSAAPPPPPPPGAKPAPAAQAQPEVEGSSQQESG